MNEQALNIKFVGEVEKRPLLYNYELPGYSRKDMTETAWCEVGSAVEMTAAECKERWKNLRAVFVRNLKPNLSGAGSKRRRPYYLAEAMQFCVPFIKVLSNATGSVPPVHQEEAAEQFSDNDTKESVQLSIPLSPYELLPPSASPVAQEDENLKTEPQSLSISASHPKNKPDFKIDVDKNFVECPQAKKPRGYVTSQNQRNEALKMFLLSMLPDLESMTDHQVRQFKRKCLQTIDDILSHPTSSP